MEKSELSSPSSQSSTSTYHAVAGIEPRPLRRPSSCFVPMHRSSSGAEFNGEKDHRHLLVTYPPTVQLSRLVNSLKGVSSRILRKEFGQQLQPYLWGAHLWSPSYFAGSVGGAPLSVLHEYVQSQRAPE